MHCNWINGTKAFSLILVIFLLSIKHQIAAQELSSSEEQQLQQQEQNLNEAKRAWNNLHNAWGKRNNGIMDYDQLQKMIQVYNTNTYNNNNADYADAVRNYDYDTNSKLNSIAENDDDLTATTVDKRGWNLFSSGQGAGKRGPGSWNNLRNTGWGKREPGNWQNLRGLWGKRSSWGRLQGSWGRK